MRMWKKFLFFTVLIGLVYFNMAYTDIGFNEFLTRQTQEDLQLSPLQTQSLTSNFAGENIGSEVEGQFIGKGVNASNITTGNLSFDLAKGGTLKLGGADNVNGIFSLRDDSDIEKILMDKEGISIKDGKITITSASNKTILDSVGLVSTNSFKADTVYCGTETSTTTSILFLTQITDLGFNLVVTRPTNVLLIANIIGQNDAANTGGLAFIAIAVDNVRVTTAMPMHGSFLNSVVANVTTTAVAMNTLQPGKHYVHAALGRTASGNALARVDSSFTYVLLGN